MIEDVYKIMDSEKINDVKLERCYAPFLTNFEICANLDSNEEKKSLNINYYNPKRNLDIANLDKEEKKPKPDSIKEIPFTYSFPLFKYITKMNMNDFGNKEEYDRLLQLLNSDDDEIQDVKDKWAEIKLIAANMMNKQYETFSTDGKIESEVKKFVSQKNPSMYKNCIEHYKKEFIDIETGEIKEEFFNVVLPIVNTNKKKYIKEIIKANPPIKLFLNDNLKIGLKMPEITKLTDYKTVYKELQDIDKYKYIFSLLENPKVFNYKESEILFDPKSYTAPIVAQNPKSTQSEFYFKLFETNDEFILKSITTNPEAIIFEEEFNNILEKIDPCSIDEELAGNPEAVKLKNFEKIFDCKNNRINNRIYYHLSKNSEAAAKYNQFEKVFNSNDEYIRINLASNPNAPRFKEAYSKLFDDPKLHLYIAQNPNAPEIDSFKELFENNDEVIKISLASNPNATRFKELFKKMFYDNNKDVVRYALENPNASEYAYLFDDLLETDDIEKLCIFAANKNMAKAKTFAKLFESNDNRVLQFLSLNPAIINYPDKLMNLLKENSSFAYYLIKRDYIFDANFDLTDWFKYEIEYIREDLAKSKLACKRPEYKYLFNDKSKKILLGIINNDEVLKDKKYVDEFAKFFVNEDDVIRRAACKKLDVYKKVHKIEDVLNNC